MARCAGKAVTDTGDTSQGVLAYDLVIRGWQSLYHPGCVEEVCPEVHERIARQRAREARGWSLDTSRCVYVVHGNGDDHIFDDCGHCHQPIEPYDGRALRAYYRRLAAAVGIDDADVEEVPDLVATLLRDEVARRAATAVARGSAEGVAGT